MAVYNPLGTYTFTDLKWLTPSELQLLFRDAKKVALEVRGRKMIQKVSKDISTMRRLLGGFDSTYNREHGNESLG